MVGIRGKDAYEEVSTHAKGQCGGILWVRAGLSALLCGEWVAGKDCGCLSAHI